MDKNIYKNVYLDKREQKILSTISGDIIYVDEIKELFPDLNNQQINKICSSLSSKGYLYRLKKGVYLVNGRPSALPVIKDPYKIALELFRGYIAFSSALRIYDLLDYEPFTIFIVTKSRSGERKIGEYVFKSVAMGERAVGMTFHKGVYVSTLAKTFFDCFYKPQYAGGYPTITKALYEVLHTHAVQLDWREFIGYFRLASSSLCQRTGYVLELVKEIERIETYGESKSDESSDEIPVGTPETGIPEEILDYFRKRVKNNTKLLPSGRSSGKYVRKWMLLDNLGKHNILSWYYG